MGSSKKNHMLSAQLSTSIKASSHRLTIPNLPLSSTQLKSMLSAPYKTFSPGK